MRLARIVTEVLSPAVVVTVLPLAVAWQATGYAAGPTLLWWVLTAVFFSVLPMIFIVRGARQGRWDGHHIRDREHRALPLLMGLSSAAVGLVIMLFGRAPRDVIAMAASMIATLLVCLVITRWWKVSLHATVAAGAMTLIILLFGPRYLLLLVPLALVCWSRVRLTDHTVAQVVIGALLGPVVGGAVFLLLP
ncbi:phosphatase PAP2 family protein [Actinophytocola sp.]|uniref:phosphatase PAP2 family protein n=1 Tax=Actinophytocola sp. TaxID=1872138 RepID=UPI002D7FF020|nr:phosphatase PAP2 family protein [Actinophytocola sp.]HET9143664.1 phosphatase PAP2 family protein [Actinophytocola sp.]